MIGLLIGALLLVAILTNNSSPFYCPEDSLQWNHGERECITIDDWPYLDEWFNVVYLADRSEGPR